MDRALTFGADWRIPDNTIEARHSLSICTGLGGPSAPPPKDGTHNESKYAARFTSVSGFSDALLTETYRMSTPHQIMRMNSDYPKSNATDNHQNTHIYSISQFDHLQNRFHRRSDDTINDRDAHTTSFGCMNQFKCYLIHVRKRCTGATGGGIGSSSATHETISMFTWRRFPYIRFHGYHL